MEALTNRVNARYVNSAAIGAPTLEREAEPLTNYFVGRMRKDLRLGDTRLGMITTLTNRFMNDSTEKSRLRSRAEVLGGDIVHYWKARTYSFQAQAALTDVAGDTAAMRRTQLGSSHYFQRPDRKETSDGLFDISYDPARTSLRGYGLYARLAKESGNWMWETAQNWRSPGFEVNDLGTLSRTDYKWMQASVLRQWTTPGRWYRDAAVIVGGQGSFNYEGDKSDQQEEIWGRFTLKNYIGVSGFFIDHPPVYDALRTRGGTVVKTSGYRFAAINVNGDSRSRISWDFGSTHGRDITDDGWNADGYADLILKPLVNLRVSLGPYISRTVEPKQYVTTVADPTATQFGGQRNVFARLDQHSLSMNTRINATFTPNLTLELFAQPFLASGMYDNLNQFVAPRSGDVALYGRDMGSLLVLRNNDGAIGSYRVDPDNGGPAAAFDVGNPNFNVHSLRGTAVLRWEYRPGSTMYFVWTQQRSGSDAFGDFDFNRDKSALFRDRPVNVFQVKASYWLGI
ncbi:MAG: DUF5916 domain-containing protein, partial [Gemmatimonadaceae bacterium]